MNRLRPIAVLVAILLEMSGLLWMTRAAVAETFDHFDVVIAGGTTAAFAAALTAAESGASTALLEPTDWVGGQLTASGVPAVDECWHRIQDPHTKSVVCDASRIARDPRNMTPLFRDMLLRTGNPGRGWVSRFCFEPRNFLCQELLPQEYRHAERLTVFRNTVVKQAHIEPASRRFTGLDAIQRIARTKVPWCGYDRLPSEDLADWYDPEPSDRFEKRFLSIQGHAGTTFIDATEWGELLVLSGASYLQGVDAEDGSRLGNDRCGQCITYGFVQELRDKPDASPTTLVHQSVPEIGFGGYRDRPDRWRQVWSYRRIRAAREEPSIGDLSLQNWGYYPEHAEGGNDYPFGYLFLSREEAAKQVEDWRGGIDLEVLAKAEARAYAWHAWFRQQAPADFHPDQIALAIGILGTGHGLSKLPYIRDTRRAIGLDGFILKYSDLTGSPEAQTATAFPDRVALGCYAADIHRMAGCEYPKYCHPTTQPLPFCIPFRALTTETYDNLLVAGKTLAQSFLANSATRLHPIEWSSGTAAGVAASLMARDQLTSRQLLDDVERLQSVVRNFTPIDWQLAADE